MSFCIFIAYYLCMAIIQSTWFGFSPTKWLLWTEKYISLQPADCLFCGRSELKAEVIAVGVLVCHQEAQSKFSLQRMRLIKILHFFLFWFDYFFHISEFYSTRVDIRRNKTKNYALKVKNSCLSWRSWIIMTFGCTNREGYIVPKQPRWWWCWW